MGGRIPLCLSMRRMLTTPCQIRATAAVRSTTVGPHRSYRPYRKLRLSMATAPQLETTARSVIPHHRCRQTAQRAAVDHLRPFLAWLLLAAVISSTAPRLSRPKTRCLRECLGRPCVRASLQRTKPLARDMFSTFDYLLSRSLCPFPSLLSSSSASVAKWAPSRCELSLHPTSSRSFTLARRGR